jgi:hypothetical protein
MPQRNTSYKSSSMASTPHDAKLSSFVNTGRSINLYPSPDIEPSWSLHRLNNMRMQQVLIPLISLETALHPLVTDRVGGQILNLCRFVRTYIESRALIRFFTLKGLKARGGPHRTCVGLWPRSTRSADSEEVAETLSPKDEGSISRSPVWKVLDE